MYSSCITMNIIVHTLYYVICNFHWHNLESSETDNLFVIKKIHQTFVLCTCFKNNVTFRFSSSFLLLQLSRVGKEHCLEIIKRCEPTEEGRKLKCLGIDGR